MGYNSENTLILATEMQAGNNKRMLLLHVCESGRHEYVVGSYFQQMQEYMPGIVRDGHGVCYKVDTGEIVGIVNNLDANPQSDKVVYSWDWGHYFGDVVSAVRYWEEEVIGEGSER